MNLLFRAKYKYKLNESPAQVKDELETLFSTPWHKTAPRLSGRFLTDYSFRVQAVLSRSVAFFGIFQSFSVLEGRLNTEDERTVIRLNARPAHLSLLLFYVLLLVTIVAYYKARTALSPESIFIAAAFTGLLVGYYFILRYSRNSLRRFFQRQMGIKSK
jgi:membrane associated rhomboid family serine protease